jgi:hypothetical protein
MDVEQAVFDDPSAEGRWDVDEQHGGRLIVRCETQEAPVRPLFVALGLIDLDAGVWLCITAFEPGDPNYAGG